MPGYGWLASCGRINPGRLYYDLTGGNMPGPSWSIAWWQRYCGGYGVNGGPVALQVRYADGGTVSVDLDDANKGALRGRITDGQSGYIGNLVDLFKLDTWQHHVLTFAGTNPCTLTHYLNGVQSTQTVGTQAVSSTPTQLWVGWQAQNVNADLLLFQFMAIFAGVMTQPEAAANYALGRTLWVGREGGGRFPTCAAGDLTMWLSYSHGEDADYAVGDATAHWDAAGIGREGTGHIPLGRRAPGSPWALDIDIGKPNTDHPDRRPLSLVSERHPRNWPAAETNYDEYSSFQSAVDTGDTFPNGYTPYALEAELWVDAAQQPKWFYVEPWFKVVAGNYHEIGAVPFKVGGAFYLPKRAAAGTIGAGATTQVLPISGIGTPADNFWQGAYLDVGGERLTIASNVGATVTLAGQLRAAPAQGTLCGLRYGRRLSSHWLNAMAGMTFDLERTTDNGLTPEANGFSIHFRHEDTDVFIYPSGAPPHKVPGSGPLRGGTHDVFIGVPDSTVRPVGITSVVEFHLRRWKAGGVGRGLRFSLLSELYDNFCCAPEGGSSFLSTRIWDSSGVTVTRSRTNWSCDTGDNQVPEFLAPDTWRHAAPTLQQVWWDRDADCYRALLQAQDSAGNISWGWLVGTWATDHIAWQDDPAASNPVMTWAELQALAADCEWASGGYALLRGCWPQAGGGYWWLIYVHSAGQDGSWCIGVPGGEDRYTPPTSLVNGCCFGSDRRPDIDEPSGAGRQHLAANRDNEFHGSCLNDFVDPPECILSGRAQVWPYNLQSGSMGEWDAWRPLALVATRDGASWRGWAKANTPLAPWKFDTLVAHWPFCAAYSATQLCVVKDDGAPSDFDLGIFWTDCRAHTFTSYDLVKNNDPGWEGTSWWMAACGPVTNDERTLVYVYNYTNRFTDWRIMYCRRGGEATLGLTTGQTSGWFCTPVLVRPAGGWGELILNAELGDGNVRVRVFDPTVGDTVISGYGYGDMDALSGAVAEQVTWGGSSLAALDGYEYLRLQFELTRPTDLDASPTLYEWWAGDGQDRHAAGGGGGYGPIGSQVIC